jgi:hypothetical protein
MIVSIMYRSSTRRPRDGRDQPARQNPQVHHRGTVAARISKIRPGGARRCRVLSLDRARPTHRASAVAAPEWVLYMKNFSIVLCSKLGNIRGIVFDADQGATLAYQRGGLSEARLNLNRPNRPIWSRVQHHSASLCKSKPQCTP